MLSQKLAGALQGGDCVSGVADQQGAFAVSEELQGRVQFVTETIGSLGKQEGYMYKSKFPTQFSESLTYHKIV